VKGSGQSGRLTRVAIRRLWLGALVFAAVATALILARDVLLDWDRIVIEAERSQRRALAAAGRQLPGTPDLAALDARLTDDGFKLGSPIFMRIFKREFELELWMKRDGRFHRFATYPICRWSGTLGPKLVEGDGQAPEGFYTVDARSLNPASRWHRAFNLGFPNVFDRAHGRTGSFLMVHGGCSSIGCYAMTDTVVDEIWRIVTAALTGGQPRFHVHIFPFRMTEKMTEERSHSRWAPFWRDLKEGYDLFEAAQVPPQIAVCRNRYTFGSAPAANAGSDEIQERCVNSAGSAG
jgi:murein L,D-transpeptidase YafK